MVTFRAGVLRFEWAGLVISHAGASVVIRVAARGWLQYIGRDGGGRDSKRRRQDMHSTMSRDHARQFLSLGLGAVAIICAFCIAALIA
jgi:hypothetical protein